MYQSTITPQIFNGIRILDFCQVIAGSYTTTILGDFGAEIIKIEPPGTGDNLRRVGPMINGKSGFFIMLNRNKKSISVDLKMPEGIELIKKLIPYADVVTENFKPGVMKDLGLDYEEVRKIKNNIIYSSVSGYGHNNKYSTRPTYDAIVQAESGLSSLNGTGEPMRSPLSVADYTSATYCALAIASALYHLKNTGTGQYIDVAMYDSLISYMDNTFLICGTNQEKIRKGADLTELGLKSTCNRHPGTSPHGIYRTKDGYIAHMSLSDVMWNKLLKIIGKEELINDPRYREIGSRRNKWKEIDAIVEEWTSLQTTDEVIRIFNNNSLPCGRVRSIDEAYNDPYNLERSVFHEIDDPVAGKLKITNTPIKLSETPARIKTTAPSLGEHNYEILMNILGFTKEKIDELIESKVMYMDIKL
jgi:crotonobetainyl-CoA:carnitine CoA-transferase CaiB-like acyl-CoA transferase